MNSAQKAVARRVAVQAAYNGLQHASAVHYYPTTSGNRWDGIDNERIYSRSSPDNYPHVADCSSFVTWCLWNALYVPHGIRDHVNGTHWRSGYTGTLHQHGRSLYPLGHVRPADLAFYGSPTGSDAHVAICVGGGRVISHGSEAAPMKLHIGYRSDLYDIRRYI